MGTWHAEGMSAFSIHHPAPISVQTCNKIVISAQCGCAPCRRGERFQIRDNRKRERPRGLSSTRGLLHLMSQRGDTVGAHSRTWETPAEVLGRVRGNESSPAQHSPPGTALFDSAEAAGTESVRADPCDSPSRLLSASCISRKELGSTAQREQIPAPSPSQIPAPREVPSPPHSLTSPRGLQGPQK